VVLRDGREITLYDAYSDNVTRGRAYLGVVFDPNAREAVVREVNPNSPAEKAGLQSGDTIVGINGQDVYSYRDVIGEVNHSSPGDHLEIAIAVGDRTETLEAVLEAMPTTRYQAAKPAMEPEVRTAQPVPTENYQYDRVPRRGVFRRGR